VRKRALQFLLLAAALSCVAAGVSAGATLPAPGDDFDDAALGGWEQMQGDVAGGATSVSVRDGLLTIRSARASWLRDQRAFYLWKDVTGDFVATTRIRVSGERSEQPTADWSLAGLLVRRATADAARES
jgi:hypothetical protein